MPKSSIVIHWKMPKSSTRNFWQMPKFSCINTFWRRAYVLTFCVEIYDFLNNPEAQWMKAIKARQKEQEQGTQLELFSRGAVFENQRTLAYLSAVSSGD